MASKLKGDELFEKMKELSERYSDALGAHNLGQAGLVRDEAAELLAANFSSVLAALELWAFPASHGSTPDEECETRRDQ
jgi:hypothetical protein